MVLTIGQSHCNCDLLQIMEITAKNNPPDNVVGIVPMAGLATRLGLLPCSKEIHPVNGDKQINNGEVPARVVCEYLLGKLRIAGINRVYIVLRDGKWDIPAYLGDGSAIGLKLAYLMMGKPWGTPYSINQAYPFLGDAIVALGFPDMVLGQGDIFGKLLEQQKRTDADIVLGLFPADRPDKVDMVDIHNGRINRIVIKPGRTQLRFTWGTAVWSPVFSRYMRDYLLSHQHIARAEPELFVGDIIQAAIETGMRVDGVHVSDKPFLDIGTKEDLEKVSGAGDR